MIHIALVLCNICSLLVYRPRISPVVLDTMSYQCLDVSWSMLSMPGVSSKGLAEEAGAVIKSDWPKGLTIKLCSSLKAVKSHFTA